MKAVTRSIYGGPEVLNLSELPKPIPADDELLVRVRATTVNRTDCAILTGSPLIQRLFTGLIKPSCPIPGTDFAGTVEDIGKEVRNFDIGDHIWGFHDTCLASQAQYLCISEKQPVLKMIKGIDHAQAVACAEGAHYAYNCINKTKINRGDRVLVNGATGAIGSAALQMLVDLGCEVTAVASSRNSELVSMLGAIEIIDYEKEDFTLKARGGYDLIIDAVGKSRFKNCKALLRDHGVYISTELGPRNENILLALRSKFSSGKKVIFPFPSDIRGSLNYIQNLLEKGNFQPVLDRTYPMENIRDAYRYVLTGMKIGNVIISYE